MMVFRMIAILCLAFVWLSQAEAAQPPASVASQSERLMFERIANALSAGQPSRESVTLAFDLPAKCDPSCDFDGGLGTVSYKEGSLRPRKEGLILVLNKLEGDCIQLKSIAARYPKGIIEDAYSHGPCWYYSKKYSRGTLGFGLNDIDAQCVSSLVINSMPDQRLKP